MNTYIVAIPSYKRAEVCNQKTLQMLKDNHIPKKHIHVYVANKEEYEEYKKILNPAYYEKLIIGIKGLVPQRQFIMEQFPKGKHIVFFDDDVDSIDLSLSPLFKGKSLDHFFKYAFKQCEETGAYIWGVYPVFNPFFRKPRPEMTTGLNFIVGPFFGIINRPKNKNIRLTITKENSEKEDSERTLRYFKEDGIVLRFNKVGFVTKFFGKTGGMGVFEARLKSATVASKRLKAEFPDWGDIVYRKNGVAEFRMKKVPASTEGKELSTSMQETRRRKISTTRKTRRKKN